MPTTVPSTHKRLEQLLAVAEAHAAALRTALSLLDGAATAKKVNGHGTVLAKALQIEGERSEKRGRGRPTGSGTTGDYKVRKAEARARGIEFLSQFDPVRPLAVADIRGLGANNRKPTGVFLANGCLKKKGNGYIRTSKPYGDPEPLRAKRVLTPKTPTAPAKRRAVKKKAVGRPRKIDTTTALGFFDHEIPVTPADFRKVAGEENYRRVPLGVLVRHGYLAHKDDGYIRTDKPYRDGASE